MFAVNAGSPCRAGGEVACKQLSPDAVRVGTRASGGPGFAKQSSGLGARQPRKARIGSKLRSVSATGDVQGPAGPAGAELDSRRSGSLI